ncbi:MAG TPA: peptidase S8, partial [Chromatiales bacterium]|nr:peptidase S8 [Chromatiales bacterium]
DPDLYVRYGSQPTEADWDCRPYEGGYNDEVCDFTNPQPGTWYVMLHAYSDFSGVNLTASDGSSGSTGGGISGNGETTTMLNENNATATQGQYLHYSFTVPADAIHLSVQAGNVTGDPDLYVRYGSQPTESD